MQYYEDIEVGTTASFGSYEVTAEEIKEFAEKYDPQPFHVDEEAAADSMFGELVASGWHTMAMCMRMVNQNPDPVAAIAGIGADDIRWHKPVTPGLQLELHTEIVDKWPSDRDVSGFITRGIEARDQHGDAVVTYETTALVKTRAYDE
ncbi:MaoC family dehydratase [Halobellus clavatus]|jgi:acyl dehydratase|uniref:Acyl dehydratase n=1 Tax=Halobellus clavatus TaxID=660517 RepID=A0A1H3H002_9EURY|nr:MaoC family dehydratase [Halobellus clavatus]SDY08852.1 Acyl dehydratase [Halobellus clavatus]